MAPFRRGATILSIVKVVGYLGHCWIGLATVIFGLHCGVMTEQLTTPHLSMASDAGSFDFIQRGHVESASAALHLSIVRSSIPCEVTC